MNNNPFCNRESCKTLITDLRSGQRFRDVSGHTMIFDHVYKDMAVWAKNEETGVADVYAACAVVEPIE